MPNLLAYAALILWPFFAKAIKRKFLLEDAVILLFFVPYLFLPVKTSIDLPLLPPLSKTSVAALVALLLYYREIKKRKEVSISGVYRLCLWLIFLGAIATVFLNNDPLIFDGRFIPGLKAWDLIGVLFVKFTVYFIPFFIGYYLLNSAQAHRRFVYWFVCLGLLYMLPMLWEIRMSPQLHTKIYGFFPHEFAQQVRDGGYRPVVFLGHGLLVAFFIFSACASSFILMKNKIDVWRISGRYAFLLLLIMVFLCKTMGVFFYLFMTLALLLIFKPKAQFMFAASIAFVVLLYPAIREAASPQLRGFVEVVAEHNEERSRSLEFRLNNENVLLDKANQKKWFGWGSWGRNLIYDDTGKALSIVDGQWIITFGAWGWVGYFSFFGLLFFPLLHWFNLLRVHSTQKVSIEACEYSAVLGLILVANMIDFIPNSSLSHITLLLAGALAGRVALLRVKKTESTLVSHNESA